jgi:hypothetical protein
MFRRNDSSGDQRAFRSTGNNGLGRVKMIIHHVDGYWGIQSSRNKPAYLIFWARGMKRWICTCPDFEYREIIAKKDCKHIKMLKNFLASADIDKLEEVKKNGSAKI